MEIHNERRCDDAQIIVGVDMFQLKFEWGDHGDR